MEGDKMNEEQERHQPSQEPPESPPPHTPPERKPISQYEKDERLWSILCHLLGLLVFVGVPFGNVIGPLVIWLIKKDEFPAVNEHGKAALNFQISMLLYLMVSIFLMLIIVGFLLIAILAVVELVFVIIAAVKASEGEVYHYPLSIKFIS